MVILVGILVAVGTLSVLIYFKDMFIVVCPSCKSINRSTMTFSSDSIKNRLDSERGFKRSRQLYYVTERFVCNVCGKEFERIARKQDFQG